MTNSLTSNEREQLNQIRERAATYLTGTIHAEVYHEDATLLLSLLDSRAAGDAPRHYFCSCGGALTAEEYIVHYFEMGHDRGETPVSAPASTGEQPIDMVLFCPRCGTQHIDAPESDDDYRARLSNAMPAELAPQWTNPPHKSHLCHNCYAVWRPADVPTNGVAQIKTRGKDDNTWTNSAAVPAATSTTPVDGEREHCTRRPWPCQYSDARQCAHDRMLGAECPTVCNCECHAATTPPAASSEGEQARCLVCDTPISAGFHFCAKCGPPPDTDTTPSTSEVIQRAAKEIAHEMNGGDRADLTYPQPWRDLFDDPSIANEAAYASWIESILSRYFGNAAAPGSPSPAHVCVKCGHGERFSDELGVCQFWKGQGERVPLLCGCNCEFAATADSQS